MKRVLHVLAAFVTVALGTGSAQQVLATVGDGEILPSDVRITARERKLHQELYEVRVEALRAAIGVRLLANEAARRGMEREDLIASEIGSKVGVPTNREITDYYAARKDRIAKPLNEVRPDIIRQIQRERAQQHLNEFISELEATDPVVVLLEPPRLPMNLDEGTRVRGPEDAPVTVIEYSDFQCPFCKRVQPVLAELSEEYGDQIRWVFKDLPLTEIHPEAMRAAQVARCAGDQEKFWEFRAKLFEQELFTDGVYTDIAEQLKVKPKPLLECADSGSYEEAVQAEALEARSLGMDGTPALLINGILLTGARPAETYRNVIDRELERAGTEVSSK